MTTDRGNSIAMWPGATSSTMTTDRPRKQYRNVVQELEDCLRRAGAIGLRHCVEIGRLAVVRGDDPAQVAASIVRNQPAMFRRGGLTLTT